MQLDADIKSVESLLATDAKPEARLIKAITAALKASAEQDFENTTDLDLANIIYINRLPVVAEDKRGALEDVAKNINLWAAFEQTKSEQAVDGKIQKGELPGDITVEAKSKRTQYRLKISEYLWRNSSWMTVDKDLIDTRTATTSIQDANLVILHTMLSMPQFTQDPQVALLFKAIGPGFDIGNNMMQPFGFTILDYELDQATSSVRPILTKLGFEVKIQKDDSGSGKDPEPARYNIEINSITRQAGFNLDLWNNVKPSEEDVKLGAELLKQRSLAILKV